MKINKIVINDCYGGFNVSQEVIQWMIDNGLEEKYYKINHKYNPESKYDTKIYLCTWDIPRHHPLLVQAVEKFQEEADGLCSSLKIVEIEGNVYRINEYDGWETVQTPDDVKWVVI